MSEPTCEPGPDGRVFDGCLTREFVGDLWTCTMHESAEAACAAEFGGLCPTFREMLGRLGWMEGDPRSGYDRVSARQCVGIEDGRPVYTLHADRSLGFETDTWHSGVTVVTDAWSEDRIWYFDRCGTVRAGYLDHMGYPEPYDEHLSTWCCDGHETLRVFWGDPTFQGHFCESLEPEDLVRHPGLATCSD